MKVVIIGGSSGIGKEVLKNAVSQNHEVHNFSRKKPDLDKKFIHSQLDVLDFNKDIFDIIEEVDALFYCPGSINLKPFQSLKEKDFIADFNINALGAAKVLQALSSKFNKGSSVVLFSSVAVQTGLKYHSSISMAKGATEGLVRALAAEWAPKVRVNALSLSLTNTPLASKFTSSEEKIKTSEERHPLQTIGNPVDIAKMAMHLASEEAKWITGQIIQIDGGLSTIKEL